MKNIKHLNIELTKRCNQKCFYCFNNSGNGNISDELSLNKWKIILSDFQKNGLKSVHFTGGEPFMYYNIIDILKFSQEVGISTTVLSNGYKVSHYAKYFSEILSKLKLAQISLDSINSIVNNRRRGYENAYNDSINAIETFSLLNVPVEISTTVSDENINDLIKIGEYAKSINAKLLIRPMINKGRAEFINLNKNFYNKLDIIINKLKTEISVNLTNDRFKYLTGEELSYSLINNFGIVTLLPNGNLKIPKNNNDVYYIYDLCV